MGNIGPIHKKYSMQLIKNYRPVSLLLVFGKMYEKIIYPSIYEYFEKMVFFQLSNQGLEHVI